MSEGKTKKSEFIRLNQLRTVVLVFINVQQTHFLTKRSLNLGLKQYIGDTVTLKHSK